MILRSLTKVLFSDFASPKEFLFKAKPPMSAFEILMKFENA